MDFNRADWNEIELKLAETDWTSLFDGLCVDECVKKFNCIIKKCFDLYVPSILVSDFTKRFPWFDRELRNIDNQKTKAHKCMKVFDKNYFRPLTEEQQIQFDATVLKFRNLRTNFKNLHRQKHTEYLNKIESELKSNPQSFFQYVNTKRKSSGYPPSMYFNNECAQGPQEIANLFSNFIRN